MASPNGFAQEVAVWKHEVLLYLNWGYTLNAESLPCSDCRNRQHTKEFVSLHPNLGSGQTIWGAWEKKVDCQKRGWVRDLHKVFSGFVLEFLLTDQLVEHWLFAPWKIHLTHQWLNFWFKKRTQVHGACPVMVCGYSGCEQPLQYAKTGNVRVISTIEQAENKSRRKSLIKKHNTNKKGIQGEASYY